MATERTAAQHLRALKRALDAGDAEAADYIRTQAIAAQETEDRAAYDPAAGMGTGAKLAAGYSRGVRNVGRHAANLVGLLSDEDLAEADRMDAPLMRSGAAQAGSVLGEAIVTAPVMAGGAGLIGRTAMGAKAIANPITRGVLEGAAQGALMANPGERGGAAVIGGALGGALPALGAGLGKAVHGLKRTPEAQRLLDAGVDLTPGQMNPAGIANQLEEAWQSQPIVGPAIKGARDNAQASFQRAAAQVAAPPGVQVTQAAPAQMLQQVYDAFEPLYDEGKGFTRLYPGVMRTAGGDAPLASFANRPGLLARAALDRNVLADDATRKTVGGWLENQVTQLPRGGRGEVSSDTLLALRSNIREHARKMAAKGDAASEASAALLGNAERAVTDALESQLPPEAMHALRTADAAYAKYKVLEDAVARTKDMPGGFTASKLSEAVAGANRGLGKGAYARGGGGPLRELSEAGTATLNVRTPATGARLAALSLPLAAVGANPVVGGALGGAALGMVGTQTGRRLAAGRTPAQRLAQAMEEQVRRRVPGVARDVTAEYMQRALVAGLLR